MNVRANGRTERRERSSFGDVRDGIAAAAAAAGAAAVKADEFYRVH